MKISDLGIKPEEFKDKIFYFRNQIKGWSRERLARELGVTAQTVYRWERGMNTPGSDAVLRALVNMRFVSDT